MQTKFDRINQDDKELLEEFLDNLTEYHQNSKINALRSIRHQKDLQSI
jgi:hypothetical protein